MLKNRFTDRLGGFTLIELLVVVLIIGILAAIALPQYQKAVLKSRLTQGMVMVRSLRDAQKVYKLANGEMATTWDALAWENCTGGDIESVYCYSGQWGYKSKYSINEVQGCYTLSGSGRVCIQGYMDREGLLCTAGKTSGWANETCKMFSPQMQECPGEADYNCYPL